RPQPCAVVARFPQRRASRCLRPAGHGKHVPHLGYASDSELVRLARLTAPTALGDLSNELRLAGLQRVQGLRHIRQSVPKIAEGTVELCAGPPLPTLDLLQPVRDYQGAFRPTRWLSRVHEVGHIAEPARYDGLGRDRWEYSAGQTLAETELVCCP